MQFYNYKTEYLFISWLSKHLDILIFIQYHIWGPISEEIDQSKNTLLQKLCFKLQASNSLIFQKYFY